MKKLKSTTRHQSGFTIVELMIATTVLSIILLLATTMMIGIGNLFYKGTNQARVQDNSRNILDEVAQHLELSTNFSSGAQTTLSNPYPNNSYYSAYCIDNTRYTYAVGVQMGTASNQLPHVLWRDSYSGGGCPPVALSNESLGTADPGGVELVAANSRLTNFQINASSTLSGTTTYSLNVGVAFGDPVLSPAPNNLCTGGTGDQYCATADLATTVMQRL